MDSSNPPTVPQNETKPSDDHERGDFSEVEIEKREEDGQDSNPTTTTSSSASQGDSAADENANEPKEANGTDEPKTNGHIPNIKAQVQFPQPQPPQPKVERLQPTLSMTDSFPAIGKFIRERSSSFSAAITKRLASLREDSTGYGDFVVKNDSVNFEVTEFKIPGVKVIVKLKSEEEKDYQKGIISFFSRSNSRDCTAVRSFFRQKGLNFVEINIDVYPKREKELLERTGSSEVPQIFINDKLFGGLVALNSLRNSGDFDRRLKEMLGNTCQNNAPAPPEYGVNDEEESEDELAGIARILRQNLPVQDRLLKMKLVKNCFSGSDLVEAIIQHMDCGRKKAIATAKMLAKKHFIHHVFRENEFQETRQEHFYRFLEHEPFILGCFNFRSSINDSEPKSVAFIGEKLMKLMSAILETYASEDRCHLDYSGISRSEEFRRYVNLARDLQRVNLQLLSPEEALALFLNLYNAMVIHAVISIGHPEGILDKRAFFYDFQYVVGGYPYSLSDIENGILRHNQRSTYSLVKPFANGDKRLELILPKFNPLIHFGLCNGTRSSPTVRFFTPQGVESELKYAAREFFQRGGIEIDLDKRTVYLTRIIKWYMVDFGQEKDILKWVLNYLDATKLGLLTHLLGDGSSVSIVYQKYDWSGNC